jgi:hypothetical protein
MLPEGCVAARTGSLETARAPGEAFAATANGLSAITIEIHFPFDPAEVSQAR